MTPVTQLVAMLRSSPPKAAAALLMNIPAERLPVVAAAMRPAEVVRLVPALKLEARRGLVQALEAKRLGEVFRGVSPDQAVALVPMVPSERLVGLVAELPDATLAYLLAGLPPGQRQRVEAVADPRRERRVLGLEYGDSVCRALVRGNLQVAQQDDCLLVTKDRWLIAVAARHGDDGRVAVRDAEDTAYRLRADGALAVIDEPAADDVVQYCRQARAEGRPLEAATWVGDQHDSGLIRVLVSLLRARDA
jgi:hypothetical protein